MTGSDKPIPKGQARNLIATSIAGEIAHLLHLGKDDRALLGDRPLSAEDVAVLVRRNADARLMKAVLSGYPCELQCVRVIRRIGFSKYIPDFVGFFCEKDR